MLFRLAAALSEVQDEQANGSVVSTQYRYIWMVVVRKVRLLKLRGMQVGVD